MKDPHRRFLLALGELCLRGGEPSLCLPRVVLLVTLPLVDRQRAFIRPFVSLVVVGLTALLLGACGKTPPADVADRLWVAQMPTGPRSPIDAFVVTDVGKYSGGGFIMARSTAAPTTASPGRPRPRTAA